MSGGAQHRPQDREHILSREAVSSASWLEWGIGENKGHRFSSKGPNLLGSKETSVPSDTALTLAKQLQNLFPSQVMLPRPTKYVN